MAVILLFASGCQSGWDDKDTLDQLYRVDENGRLAHTRSIRKPSTFGRIMETILGPFGYEAPRSKDRVNNPGTVAREAILGLSGSLEDNLPLLAFALPLFSDLALHAPFALTRAQALRALADAIECRVGSVPPPAASRTEDAEAINQAILELVGRARPSPDSASPSPGPLTPERQLALVQFLGRIDHATLPTIRSALKALGFAADRFSSGNTAMRASIATGVNRLGRQLARLTVVGVLQKDQDPKVRGETTLVLRAAGEPWAERILLDLLQTEADPLVLRKIIRSLVVYRTPAVARTLLELYRQHPTPLVAALAKRGLLNYTLKDLGRDPAAWEARLRELGYLGNPEKPAVPAPAVTTPPASNTP